MSSGLQFETPENVEVQYEPAGAGTRFVAWFIDQIFVWLTIFLIFIALTIAGVSFAGVFKDLEGDPGNFERIGTFFIGLAILILGLGSFFYFTGLELWLRGQTIGKRMLKIRVVKVDGFALDPVAILLRNIFRLLDNIPLLWVVPVMSKRTQRCGDMVAGTIVIRDEVPELSYVRTQLSDRGAAEAEFRFDSRSLGKLTESDFDAIERLLDRWTELPLEQRQKLVGRVVPALVAKMKIEQPPPDRMHRFLEDLMAAEIRRQGRLLS
jgi:uncharacterized RDD family membrane protein YckC